MTIGAVMPVTVQEQPEHIDCRDCGQLLALRWPNGRMKVVVVEQRIEDARVIIVCPRCKLQTRLRMTRAA